MGFFDRLRAYMSGRYGRDQLNTFLLITAFVLMIVNLFVRFRLLGWLVLVLLVLVYFRMFSRNYTRRAAENQRFLDIKEGLFGWITGKRTGSLFSGIKRKKQQMQDRDHAYFKCPRCRKTLRVPKGRGRIQIHCPQCGTDFIENT